MAERLLREAFGGEVRAFALPQANWEAIEAKCNAGILRVLGRLYTLLSDVPAYDCGGHEIRETILQGLKGGGLTDMQAFKLVSTIFDNANGKRQFVPLAINIIAHWYGGVEEAEKKDQASEPESHPMTTPRVEPTSAL